MTWVGIVALILILLGGFFGWRRGVLRSLINLVGLASILIISLFINFLLSKLYHKKGEKSNYVNTAANWQYHESSFF